MPRPLGPFPHLPKGVMLGPVLEVGSSSRWSWSVEGGGLSSHLSCTHRPPPAPQTACGASSGYSCATPPPSGGMSVLQDARGPELCPVRGSHACARPALEVQHPPAAGSASPGCGVLSLPVGLPWGAVCWRVACIEGGYYAGQPGCAGAAWYWSPGSSTGSSAPCVPTCVHV